MTNGILKSLISDIDYSPPDETLFCGVTHDIYLSSRHDKETFTLSAYLDFTNKEEMIDFYKKYFQSLHRELSNYCYCRAKDGGRIFWGREVLWFLPKVCVKWDLKVSFEGGHPEYYDSDLSILKYAKDAEKNPIWKTKIIEDIIKLPDASLLDPYEEMSVFI